VSDLHRFLIEAMKDWHSQLEEIETHYDEDNEFVDNQRAKEDLMREIRETRSKLERVEGGA
jgi:hypothetical protein